MITPVSASYNIQNFPNLKRDTKFPALNDRVSFGADITKVYKSSEVGDFFKVLEMFCLNDNSAGNKLRNIFERVFIKFSTDFLLFACGKDALKEVNMATYVVKKGNKIIGGTILEKSPQKRTATFQFLVIDKQYQCKKESVKAIYQVIKQALSDCKNDNIDYIKWKVRNKNKKAYNMYKKIAQEKFSTGDISLFRVPLSNLEKCIDELKKNHPKLLG